MADAAGQAHVVMSNACTRAYSYCSLPVKELEILEKAENLALGSFSAGTGVDVLFGAEKQKTGAPVDTAIIQLFNAHFEEVTHEPDGDKNQWTARFAPYAASNELKQYSNICVEKDKSFSLAYGERPTMTRSNSGSSNSSASM
eukprot:1443-Heterococcus_DN1.PRE.11